MPRLNPLASALNPPSRTSDRKRSCWSASRSLFRRISLIIPCSRAQFGHSVSFSAKHLACGIRQLRPQEESCTSDEDAPLVIAVIAHEVHCGEIQSALTCRALCDMEDTRVVGVGQFFDLTQLRLRLRPIRGDELLVLFVC